VWNTRTLKLEVGDHGVSRVESGPSTPRGRSRSRRLVGRRGDVLDDKGDGLFVGGYEVLCLSDMASLGLGATARATLAVVAPVTTGC
jgi:hypothetical protein